MNENESNDDRKWQRTQRERQEDVQTNTALLNAAISRIEADFKAMEQRLNDYVLQLVFDAHRQYVDQRLKPLEKVVYGLVGLVLIAVVTAIMTIVIRK